MKILVVDDSAIMRSLLKQSVADVGNPEVFEAADGEQAIAAATAQDFDVILMDWNMPKKSGLEAVEGIRAAGKKTPVMMVTTEAEKSRVIQAIKAGANDYLVKPFEPKMVAEKIKKLVAQHV